MGAMKTGSRITELIGVYDADATLIGELAYWVGARFGVRHCSLCDITHSLFRTKSTWLEAVKKFEIETGISFKAYHRNDQPVDIRSAIAGAYPAVIARFESNELQLLMSEAEITSCGKSPKALLEAINLKLFS